MRFDAFSKNIFRRPAGYLLQDFAPRGKARVTDLGELIEATENDGCSIIVTRCRKWHLIDGLVAPLTVRHSKELLAVKMLALSWRIRVGIRDAVVDRFEAGCIQVAQPGGLNGR